MAKKIIIKPTFTKKEMEKYNKEKAKEKKLAEKYLFCPHCKKDLRKVGFHTFENAEIRYEWSFSRKNKYFNSRSVGSEPIDGEIRAECGNCDEELDWNELSLTGLV